VQRLLVEQSPYGLNLKVDLSEFDEALLYYRGTGTIVREERNPWRFYLRKDRLALRKHTLAPVAPAKKRRMGAVLMSDSRVMAGGDEVRSLFASPVEQRSQLEISITGNARVGSPAVQIVAGKRLYDCGGKLRSKVQKRVRNAEHTGDFCSAAVVGTDARTAVFVPHAERHSVDLIALLDEQTRRH